MRTLPRACKIIGGQKVWQRMKLQESRESRKIQNLDRLAVSQENGLLKGPETKLTNSDPRIRNSARRTIGKGRRSLWKQKGKENAMSATITVEQAQAKLKELIHQLAPGEEVVITENEQPVAKLVSEQPKAQPKQRPGPGLGKGMITFIAPDFDAPLEDMKEYME